MTDGEHPDDRRPPRVGVMGGTFDPIHHGHLVAASEVQSWFDLDEVVFVPTGQPWQKAAREVSPAEDRYLMTVIATASNPRFWVSRVDIDRRRSDVHHRHAARPRARSCPDADLYFITGADALAEIFTWRDADELFDLAHFVGCTRPGYDDGPRARWTGCPATGSRSWRSRRWRSPRPTAASAALKGEPVWYLVPDGVVQYIAKHALYAPTDPTSKLGDPS